MNTPLLASDNRTAYTRLLPAEPWLWIFILADMSIFALFFVAYLWSFSDNRAAFVADAVNLSLPLGLLNTLILLTSSYLVVQAVRAHRCRELESSRRLLGWTLVASAAFAAVKIGEYGMELMNGNGLTSSAFFMYYYVLTGLHLMHVTIGSVLLIAWRQSLVHESGPYAATTAESLAGYWHMVDLLWIVIFSFLYIGSHV
jgi:nitric oxide reductase NorE protein